MLRRLLAGLFGGRSEEGGTDDQGQDSEQDEGGFLRSRLDASVLRSHGVGEGTVEVDEPQLSDDEAAVLEQYHDEQ